MLIISSRDTWFVTAIISKVFKLNTPCTQISSGLIPDGWTEWAPWEDCTGECTFVPTTKFRNRTCLLPVSDSKYPNTDSPMSGCPTNGTETRDCHPYWQSGSVNCPIGQKLSLYFLLPANEVWGKVIVFTRVCHSVQGGVGFPACITGHMTSMRVCLQGDLHLGGLPLGLGVGGVVGWPSPTGTRKAGGMHHTAMLSCYKSNLLCLLWLFDLMQF